MLVNFKFLTGGQCIHSDVSRLDFVQPLIDAGADVNTLNVYKRTPLMMVIRNVSHRSSQEVIDKVIIPFARWWFFR